MSTSRGVPRISPGIRNENPTSVPVTIFRSMLKSAPLAETFTVEAGNSSSSAERTTGRLSGKRTAQRTSCRLAPPELTGETGNSVLDGIILPNPLLEALTYCTSSEVRRRSPGTPKFLPLRQLYRLLSTAEIPLTGYKTMIFRRIRVENAVKSAENHAIQTSG